MRIHRLGVGNMPCKRTTALGVKPPLDSSTAAPVDEPAAEPWISIGPPAGTSRTVADALDGGSVAGPADWIDLMLTVSDALDLDAEGQRAFSAFVKKHSNK